MDTIKSGQIQKFEVTVELFWKTMKLFLFDIHGIEAISPKMTMKELFLAEYVNKEEYELLFEMVNDRNRIAHIYNEQQFNLIHTKINQYLKIMQSVVQKAI